MSIIGNNLLNFAVNEMKKTNPAEILQIMHEGLKSKMLKQNEKITTVDGMDLALITYEPSTQTVMFSGARNPIFHVSNDQITEYKPNKFGIGDNFNLKVKTKVSFTSVEFIIKKGDALYLFSDGYTDQFGQIKRRKFMKPFFKRLLIAVQGQTMEEQHNALETTIDEWKGNTKQIDDILVIGIKF